MSKGEFCQVNGDWCPCGKVGRAILECRKPLSSERMAEIFEDMRAKAEQWRDNIPLPNRLN